MALANILSMGTQFAPLGATLQLHSGAGPCGCGQGGAGSGEPQHGSPSGARLRSWAALCTNHGQLLGHGAQVFEQSLR